MITTIIFIISIILNIILIGVTFLLARDFNKLSAKYSKQIEKTQLKHNWVNQAFVHKR